MELPLASALAGALLLLAVAAVLVRRAVGGKSLQLVGGKQSKGGGLRVDATSGDGANAAAAAASAAASKGASKPQVTLLFGTQTGTAERFAKQLKAELLAISNGGGEGAAQVDVDVVDCEEFDAAKRLASQSLVLFLVATYGDGEPTDNAADLYNWLLKSAGEAERAGAASAAASDGGAEEKKRLPLSEVSFGVFGLGNKQYEHFCAVGKRVHRAMTSLGATPVVRRGDGDDDDDIEGDFDAWKGELLASLAGSPLLGFKKEEAGVSSAPVTPSAAASAATASIIPAASTVPCYAVAPSKAKKAAPRLGAAAASSGTGAGPHSPALARVVAVRELHSSLSERSCTHVELDIGSGTASALSYEAGDHIGILPSIPTEVAAEVARALGLDPKAMVEISIPSTSSSSSSSSSSDLPRAPCDASPCSVSDAIARFADVLGPVPKAGVAAFAAFAASAKDGGAPEELAKLSELLAPTPAGMAAYKKWHAHSRCVLELLREFPETAKNLPLGALLGGAVAPRLAVRFYSISSSPNHLEENEPSSSSPSPSTSSTSSIPSHRRVSITAALVRETTATGRAHEGPASSGLRACGVGDEVAFFLRKSAFRLPSDASRPIVMVGPGTGLAPFRGFLQERAAILRKRKSGEGATSSLGEAHLFFGCRSKDHDFIYREELEAFEQLGALTRLRVAFSRERADEKVYVQHLLAKEGTEIARLIKEERASVYICGDARAMAKDVHAALRDALGGGSVGDAVLKEMAESGRLQKDVW